MRGIAGLIVFLVAVVGGGLLIGYATLPGEWYASLIKPPFNPPNWLFAPVWTILYVLIAIAGWRVFRVAPKSGAFQLWIAQMILNFLWSPIFFGLEEVRLALAIIATLLVTILGFIFRARPIDHVAATLFIPYAAWVAFATLLNASLWWLN
jgi:translocator protein